MKSSPVCASILLGGLVFACAGGVAALAGTVPDDVATGQSLYLNKCGGCHSVDADRIGPRHRNVVGRSVASVQGYDYSDALKKLGGTWTPARLDQWLSGTQKMAPGSKMYLELDDPAERQMIITYLRSVSPPSALKDSQTTSQSARRSKQP